MSEKGGRPTMLNEETQHKIVTAIKEGNYIETASAYAGIDKSTLYDWLKRGEREKQRIKSDNSAKIKKDEAKFVQFSNAVQKALAESEMRDVSVIGKAAENQWQAAAWRLERKFPEKWGRKFEQKIEHSGNIDIAAQSAKVEKFLDDLEI